MMKRTLTLLFYFIVLTTVGCRNDIEYDNDLNLQKNGITKKEAQTFFQNTFSSIVTRGSICESDRKLLVPDDYTPVWTSSVISENERQWICETPILASRNIWAKRHDYLGPYNVRTVQRLVVIKDKSDSTMSAYIMTVIPDRKYVGRNIENIYTHSSPKNFSGIVLYSSLTRKLVRISEYYEGKYIVGVYMNDRSRALADKLNDLELIMVSTKLMEYGSVTRGGGGTMVYENGEWIVYCPNCGGAGCHECSSDARNVANICICVSVIKGIMVPIRTAVTRNRSRNRILLRIRKKTMAEDPTTPATAAIIIMNRLRPPIPETKYWIRR